MGKMTTVEAYAVLEVSSSATESEVKTAYKKKALKTHVSAVSECSE
jgi:curved DNA-binding protein CbpA